MKHKPSALQGRRKHNDSDVYLADPFCSGQKGAVENANKLLRQYFPKGTDFRIVDQ